MATKLEHIKEANVSAAIRESSAAAIPEGTIDHKQWLKHKNLRRLNFLLVFPLISIFTLG